MASYIKTLKDINDDVILPKTSSSAVIMADGTTSLENITSQFIRAVDSSAESPVLISASEIVLSDLSGNYTDNGLEGAMTEVANSISAIENTLANLSADAVDIVVTPAGNIESTNVQDALEELDTALGNINLTAGAISNTPAGSIAATNVQAAINELDSEKLSISGGTMSGNLYINNSSPTIYLQDTDNRSAMVHVNSNIFYVLRGSANNSTSWAQYNGLWPLQINLENNDITGGGNITAYSDIRLKTNITDIDNPIDKVKGLHGVYYYKNETPNSNRKIGVIAQEIINILPEVVIENGEDKILSVDYGNITALLIEAIKEQQKQIDELKARL